MRTHLVIFAKAPLPGQAKTRLIPALGPDGAARLAARMLVHTVHTALMSHLGPVELCVTPAPSHPVWQQVLPQELSQKLLWSDQGEGDLGARLFRAAARSIREDVPVLLMGTDCPALNATTLRHGAQELTTHDALLIPSTDGGYVVLGLRRCHPALFTRILWSTPAVAQQTRERMIALGWHWSELPALPDIDEPQDLQSCTLVSEEEQPFVTRSVSFQKEGDMEHA